MDDTQKPDGKVSQSCDDARKNGPNARCAKCLTNVTAYNVVGNAFLIVIKAYLGIVGGSKALFADAIHSLGDLLASFMMYIALKVADKPKSKNYAYGRGKVEYISALIISFFLVVLGIYIFIDAAKDIYVGRFTAPHLVTAWGALISIVVNELMSRQASCVGTLYNKPSIIAVALESRVDTWSSAAVLAGIVGAKISYPIIDSIAAILVAIIILKSAADMLIESTRKLLDISMDVDNLDKIKAVVSATTGVLGIKNIRTRELGSTFEVDITVFVDKDLRVDQFPEIKENIVEAVHSKLDFGGEVIVHFKPFVGENHE